MAIFRDFWRFFVILAILVDREVSGARWGREVMKMEIECRMSYMIENLMMDHLS